MDRSVIEAYAAGPAKVRAAVAGLTREELTSPTRFWYCSTIEWNVAALHLRGIKERWLSGR